MAHSAPMTKQKAPKTNSGRGRAVRVHGLKDALRATAMAQELDVAMTLISAPNAAASLGPAWFRNIVSALELAYPNAQVDTVLDCGDSAGYALAALRAGVKAVQLSGRRPTVEKIEEIASSYGARLAQRPRRILDPHATPNPEEALRNWLRNGKID